MYCEFAFINFLLFTQSPSGNNVALYYALVLTSLVLSWVESWVLDVKVRIANNVVLKISF